MECGDSVWESPRARAHASQAASKPSDPALFVWESRLPPGSQEGKATGKRFRTVYYTGNLTVAFHLHTSALQAGN